MCKLVDILLKNECAIKICCRLENYGGKLFIVSNHESSIGVYMNSAQTPGPVFCNLFGAAEPQVCIPVARGTPLHRHAGGGGRREQAPLLSFGWGSRGSKSALFKCNDLFSNC